MEPKGRIGRRPPGTLAAQPQAPPAGLPGGGGVAVDIEK